MPLIYYWGKPMSNLFKCNSIFPSKLPPKELQWKYSSDNSNFDFDTPSHIKNTHCTCCHCYSNARDKGQVIPWVNSVPDGWEEECGSSRIVRTALVTHPAQTKQQKLTLFSEISGRRIHARSRLFCFAAFTFSTKGLSECSSYPRTSWSWWQTV